MSRLLKRKQVNNAFLGFVRMVKEENVDEKYKGKSDLGAVHLWREDYMRGLVNCWTVWTTSIILYVLCVCPLDVGIICVFLRPVSPTQCRVGR